MPEALANCSIRYSTSNYSNDSLRRLPRRVPVVKAVQPGGIGADGAGEELDGVHVVEVQVVVEDRGAHVVRRAVVDQVAGCGTDRVVGVPHIASLPVVRPGPGQELHRSQPPRRRWAVVAPEAA